MDINQIETSVSKVSELTAQLTRSLRRPTGSTLRLIDRALSYLIPFESPKASVTSSAEKQDLIQLLHTHRDILCPYININRIESNLHHDH